MRTRLYAAAEQREHAALRGREISRNRRRDRRRAHLGNEASVHRRQRPADIGAVENDRRFVRWKVELRIGWIERHEASLPSRRRRPPA